MKISERVRSCPVFRVFRRQEFQSEFHSRPEYGQALQRPQEMSAAHQVEPPNKCGHRTDTKLLVKDFRNGKYYDTSINIEQEW
jgi:hypothetical protein